MLSLSLYCGFQDLFMCFGLLLGADLLGCSVKDFNDLKCSFALPPGSQSVELPNFVTEKDTERNLIFGLQHWCHSRKRAQIPSATCKKPSSTLLAFVSTCSLHLPSHSLLACHPCQVSLVFWGEGAFSAL